MAPARYRRVAEMLRGQITRGLLPPGALAPGGAALAHETGSRSALSAGGTLATRSSWPGHRAAITVSIA